MPDMLVRLYALPDPEPLYADLAAREVTIKRVMTPNTGVMFRWIESHFSEGWAHEACSAIPHGGLFAAVRGHTILGFAAYDATARGFFGPIGVDKDFRMDGIGRALLLRALHAMRADGYGYAIIGGAGPQEFYRKCCGATPIPDSSPGIYSDLI